MTTCARLLLSRALTSPFVPLCGLAIVIIIGCGFVSSSPAAAAASASSLSSPLTTLDLADFAFDSSSLSYSLHCRCGAARVVRVEEMDARRGGEMVRACEGCSSVVRIVYEPTEEEE